MEFLSERIDDLPLLLEICERLSLSKIIEKNIPTHLNQKGFNNGQIFTAWIAYILSEGDHRKSHVSDWASLHKQCLSAYFQKDIRDSEFTDDRLTFLLTKLSDEELWPALEKDLFQGTVEVLQISTSSKQREPDFSKKSESCIARKVRLDSTTISCHHKLTEEGIIRYGGHSKDHRPDLPQLKIMVSTDDELQAQIATDIVAGNQNDDILYLPNIERTRDILGEASDGKKNLYVGDSKMSSTKIRGELALNKEYYICPIQLNTKSKKELLQNSIEKVLLKPHLLKSFYREKNEEELVGKGYEFEREEEYKKTEENTVQWKERVFLIRSQSYFESEKAKMEKELEKGVEGVKNLKGKQCKSELESKQIIEKKVKEYLKKHSLEKLVSVEFKTEVLEKTYQRKEIQCGKERKGSYTLKKYRTVVETVKRRKEELENNLEKLGWRIYLTNIPCSEMSLEESYKHYRGSQYLIENSFHVLKDKPIGVRPIFVWKECQIKGLMRLLMIVLKIATIITTKLKTELKGRDEELTEVYAGQPKKKTSSPSIKTILNLFYRQGIILTGVYMEGVWKWGLSQMSLTCKRILEILELEESYQNILSSLQTRISYS